MSVTVSPNAAARKRAIVTYHWVLTIIHAAAAIVRKSMAARRATPARKGLKAILLHAPVERGAREAERLGGPADVSAMRLERSLDGFPLHRIECRCFRWQRSGRSSDCRRPCRGEREVTRLEHRAFAENDRALDGVAQGAHVPRPGVADQALQGCRAQSLGRRVVFLRVDRDGMVQEQRNVFASLP